MKPRRSNCDPLSRSATILSPQRGERAGRGIRPKAPIQKGSTNAKRGFTLIECLAYACLFALVLGFATHIFFQCWDENKALRRNAEDIVRALHAGDQWRADLRAASGPVQLTDANGEQKFSIPSSGGDVLYIFSNGQLRRQAGSLSEVWLPGVAASRMLSDARQNGSAWRWELELKPSNKVSRMRPLFTFEAIAGGAINR